MRNLHHLYLLTCFYLCTTSLNAAVTAVSGLDSVEKAKQHTNPLKIWTLLQEPGWKSSVHFGASVSQGNSENSLVTAGFTLDKKRGQNEYFAKLSYAYGKDSGNVNKDEILASASWKRVNSSDYYTGIRMDYRRDELADISHRMGATLLQGMFLIKEEKKWLAPEIGIGFSSQEISNESSESMNIYAGVHSEFKLSDKTRLYENFSIFSPVDQMENYWIYGEIGIETILTDRISLKLFIQDQYEASPAKGREHNDLRFITSIEYRF